MNYTPLQCRCALCSFFLTIIFYFSWNSSTLWRKKQSISYRVGAGGWIKKWHVVNEIGLANVISGGGRTNGGEAIKESNLKGALLSHASAHEAASLIPWNRASVGWVFTDEMRLSEKTGFNSNWGSEMTHQNGHSPNNMSAHLPLLHPSCILKEIPMCININALYTAGNWTGYKNTLQTSCKIRCCTLRISIW